jgi:hypothetical protein
MGKAYFEFFGDATDSLTTIPGRVLSSRPKKSQGLVYDVLIPMSRAEGLGGGGE